MAKIRCENVENGLRSSEALASILDLNGKTHFIRVERDYLYSEGSTAYYLPVGVVGRDIKANAVLIELPHEAETGANRLWVKQSLVEDLSEAVA